MIFTLADMRTFARSLDTRIEDTDKYNDAWVNDKIEEGLAIAQDMKQSIFFTKEKYNIETNLVTDGLTVVEIIPQKEVHSMWTVEYDKDRLELEITANNHIILRRIENAPLPDNYDVVIRYFFYHTLPFTEIETSMEAYRMIKHCIAVSVFQWLQDNESAMYYTALAESMVMKNTFDMEKDLMKIPVERLWRASWA